MKSLTQQQRGIYVLNQGYCPNCTEADDSNINYGGIDFCKNEVFQDAECSKCGHNWSDIYTLSNSVTVGECTTPFKLTVAVGEFIIGEVNRGCIDWSERLNFNQISDVEFDTFQELRGYMKAIDITPTLAVIEPNYEGIAVIRDTPNI